MISLPPLSRLGCIGTRFLAGLMLLLVTACQSWRDDLLNDAQNKKFYQPVNFNGEKQLPAGLRRVLVLPVYGGQVVTAETSQVLDGILINALQQKARFEVVSVSREEMQRRFSQPEFSSAALLPHRFLDELGQAYGAEAVLFVDVTLYAPYAPLAVGFRTKLVSVTDVRLIWTFDDAFSASDPTVVNSVQRAGRKEGSAARVPADMTVGTFQSPRRFAAYAADTMFDTLPPR